MSVLKTFGTMPDGRPVEKIALTAGEIEAHFIPLGATIQAVHLKGFPHNLTLGLPTVEHYLTPGHCAGNIVGPVANRISGAKAEISGKSHHFEANEGANTLHSGPTGIQWQLWDIVHADTTGATFQIQLPDGLGGFPGNRQITAQFSVTAPADLTMILSAETDAPTLMNPANHSYWVLNGASNISGHTLRIAADRLLPTTENNVPTGQAKPVGGTPMDLRQGITLPGPPLDNNFCLSDDDEPLRPVAWLSGPNGLSMVMETTAPGLQIYDGRRLSVGTHGPYAGLALEAQRWPDAPSNPVFPSVLLSPGEAFRQITRWRFRGRSIF